MYVVTSEEMRFLDRLTIDGLGIPAMALMENAGRAVAAEALNLIREKQNGGPDSLREERWLILAGKGNNGGDGFAAARHLSEAGIAADIVLAVPGEALTDTARQQWQIAVQWGIPCLDASKPGAEVQWRRYTGIIDALLGTGASGAPRGAYAELIRSANASGLPIVAADIPSGLDADTGAVLEPCICASRTVALAFLKRGLVQYPGVQTAGRVTVAPIGIPERLARDNGIRVRYMSKDRAAAAAVLETAALTGERQADSHKGTYGHVLTVAGSLPMLGAGLLCARAALRAGCGLVTWAMPESLAPLAAGKAPEVMLALLSESLPRGPEPVSRADEGSEQPAPLHPCEGWAGTDPLVLAALASSRSAAAIGPGLGRWTGDSWWLKTLWENTACPLVLDADALNMLAEAEDWPRWSRPGGSASIILTPHPGEMARLCRLSTAQIQDNRIALAQRFAEEHGVILVLKGARTVTAWPDGSVYINATGNPGMATGGSGDVLAGVIASLAAQGLPAGIAAAWGVHLHGAAGDRAAANRPAGAASLLASDIMDQL